MGANAIHRAAPILERLNEYEPRRPVIDGLVYHEGLNAVFIRGGVAGNVLPDECVVEVNYRFAPDRSEAEAEAFVREFFAGYDVRVTDSAPGALPGLAVPAARAFIEAVGGEVNPKFGWTDVARFTALGVPAVNFGPGDPHLGPQAGGARAGRARSSSCERRLRRLAGRFVMADGEDRTGVGKDSNDRSSTRGRSSCAATRSTGSTTDQRLLDSRGPSDWVHTDPWRVLRIQAEFVEGFGALAELGPAVGGVRVGPHPPRRPGVRDRRGGRPQAGRRPASP